MVKTNQSENPAKSAATSSANQKRPYKGVRMRSWGSWVSEIRAPSQKTRIWLGSYSNPEAAARAYDAALLCLKGSSAALNFPSLLHRHHHLPPPADSNATTCPMSPKSIQRIAAAAAAATSSDIQALSSPAPTPVASSTSLSSETNEDCRSTSTTTTTRSSSTCMESEGMDDTWMNLGAFQSPTCMDPAAVNVPAYSFWEGLDHEEGDFGLWSFF